MDLVGMIDIPVDQEFADELVIRPVPEDVFGIDPVLHNCLVFLTNSRRLKSVCRHGDFIPKVSSECNNDVPIGFFLP